MFVFNVIIIWHIFGDIFRTPARLVDSRTNCAFCQFQVWHGRKSDSLTLSRLEAGRFFLHPARLPVFLLRERRVEAGCPEAFSASSEVPVCPTVPAKAIRKKMNSPACKIFNAAFSSRSRTIRQAGQMWVRTD